MIEGLLTCWRGLQHLEHRGYIYVWANVLWVVLSLPLITAPAAWAGLIAMSQKAHTSPSANINDFWDGFKANLRLGLILGVFNIVFIVITATNLWFYQGVGGLTIIIFRFVWIGALVVWLMLQFYAWPLLNYMESPTFKGALRNAAAMILMNPGFTFGLLIGIALIVAFSTILVPTWFLLTGGLLAAISTTAVRNRLEKAGVIAITPSIDTEFVG